PSADLEPIVDQLVRVADQMRTTNFLPGIPRNWGRGVLINVVGQMTGKVVSVGGGWCVGYALKAIKVPPEYRLSDERIHPIGCLSRVCAVNVRCHPHRIGGRVLTDTYSRRVA